MASKAQIYYSYLFLGALNFAVIVFCLEKTAKLNTGFFYFSSEIAWVNTREIQFPNYTQN